MIQSKDLYGLLIFFILLINSNSLEDACQSRQVSSMIDISTSKISKGSVYEYKIQTFQNPTNFNLNEKGQFKFTGNFSRITLLNKALKKQYIYYGKQMLLRIPSMHYYSKNKSAEAQLQIIHYLEGEHNQNRHKILSMTHLYLVTKFLSKVQIGLCNTINKKLTNQTNFNASKLLKIIQKTPILMYQGTKEFYPCRNDILCMVRKQFALISEQDLTCLKEKMKIKSASLLESKVRKYNQKNLLQVSQISEESKLNKNSDL